MKFIGRHRNDLFKIMDKHGVDQLTFTYVKRRGRIFIISDQAGVQFGYLRKKETTIDPETKQWVDGTWFKVQVNGEPEQEVPDWPAVTSLFEKWLVTTCG